MIDMILRGRATGPSILAMVTRADQGTARKISHQIRASIWPSNENRYFTHGVRTRSIHRLIGRSSNRRFAAKG
jgi:hypothetical protein